MDLFFAEPEISWRQRDVTPFIFCKGNYSTEQQVALQLLTGDLILI